VINKVLAEDSSSTSAFAILQISFSIGFIPADPQTVPALKGNPIVKTKSFKISSK
jgi:hypothetical protein